MNGNKISRFKKDFGDFMHEGYMHKIHTLMVGCLNQPELLQMIPSKKIPKCSVLNCIIYLNWSMLSTCPVSWSSHLLALVSCINTTLSLDLLYLVKRCFICAFFSHCRPNFILINKMLLTWHQCSISSARGNRLCLHFAADYLDLIRELGKRPGSLSAINLQTISHFICLFSVFRTVLLKKACQIPVAFAAYAQAACVGSLTMDFQYLFYIFMGFTIIHLFYHYLE